MVLAGGIVINVGWGLAIAGGLLLLMTLATVYLFGVSSPKGQKPGAGEAEA